MQNLRTPLTSLLTIAPVCYNTVPGFNLTCNDNHIYPDDTESPHTIDIAQHGHLPLGGLP